MVVAVFVVSNAMPNRGFKQYYEPTYSHVRITVHSIYYFTYFTGLI